MSLLVDTHCHLNFKVFDSDRNEVLARARQAGLKRIMIPGIDLGTSREAVQMSEIYAEIYAAVGVHPNEASSWRDAARSELGDLAKNRKVIAIGEIGLDYYRDRAPRNLQLKTFTNQLELANELGLPVIIHFRDVSSEDRQAMKDTLDLLAEWVSNLQSHGEKLSIHPGVLHSFSGDLAAAWRAVEMNFCVGITGPVTYRNAALTQQVVKSLPLENILIETDAPFLTPHPFRGQRNEPAHVQYIADKIAEIRQTQCDDIIRITTENADNLFRW